MPEGFVDQALGLRQLFRPVAARVLPIVAGEGLEPGRAALAVARRLNASGHRCLIIDASRGDVARRLGLAAKYELRHVDIGDRTLADVVLGTGDIRVLPAARGLAALADDHPAERLADLRRQLGAREDWILIAANSALAAPAAAFAGGAEVAIACGQSTAGRTAAYSVMKRIVNATATQHFRLIADGDAGEATREDLDAIARHFLGARVDSGITDPRTWTCAQLT